MKVTGRTRGIDAAARCLLLLVFGSPLVSACTYAYEPKEVGRNSSVQVVDRGAPVVGLHIERNGYWNLSDGKRRPVLRLMRAADGLAELRAVKPGAYSISSKTAAFSPADQIVVKKIHSSIPGEKITIEWPGIAILPVQSASGLLSGQPRLDTPRTDGVHPVFGPIQAAKLTRQHAASEQIVELQEASQSGAFEFGAVSAGRYLPRGEAPADAASRRLGFDGYVPIEIDPSAKASTLNLVLFPGVWISLAYRNGEKPAVQ